MNTILLTFFTLFSILALINNSLATVNKSSSDFFYCNTQQSENVAKSSLIIQLKPNQKMAVITYVTDNIEFECSLLASQKFDYFLLCEKSFLPEHDGKVFLTMDFPHAIVYATGKLDMDYEGFKFAQLLCYN